MMWKSKRNGKKHKKSDREQATCNLIKKLIGTIVLLLAQLNSATLPPTNFLYISLKTRQREIVQFSLEIFHV